MSTAIDTNIMTLWYFLDRDDKLRHSPVRRIFESGGLHVFEIANGKTDYKYEVIGIPAPGCSLEKMLGHYQAMVATGCWPNRSGCDFKREEGNGEEKKGKPLEVVRLRFPDGIGISAPRMVAEVAERYAGKPVSELEGTIKPYVESSAATNGHFDQGWIG